MPVMSTLIHSNKSLAIRPANINTIPVEILLKIFMYNASQNIQWHLSVETLAEPYHQPQPVGDPSKDTRVVSHVCSHWRQIVLEAPIIWSRLMDCQTLPHSWFKEVYRRAKQIPLTLVFMNHLHQQFNVNNIARADSNLSLASDSRTLLKELHLCVDADFMQPNLIARMMSLMLEPQPHLTKLSLDFAHFNPSDDPDGSFWVTEEGEDDEVPYMFQFDEYLRNSPSRYTQPHFQSLTYLRLSCLPEGLSALTLLSHTPNLQKLAFLLDSPQEIIPIPENTISSSGLTTRVRLPHLTHVYLKGCSEPILLLLDFLDIAGAQLSLLACEMTHCVDLRSLTMFRDIVTRLLGPTALSNIPAGSTSMVILPVPSVNGSFLSQVTTPRGQLLSLDVSRIDPHTTGEQETDTMGSIMGCYSVLYPMCTHLVVGCPAQSTVADVIWFLQEIDLPFVLDMARANNTFTSLREVTFPCSVYSVKRMFNSIQGWLDRRPSTGSPIKVINMYFVDAANAMSNAVREEFDDGSRFIRDKYEVNVCIEHRNVF